MISENFRIFQDFALWAAGRDLEAPGGSLKLQPAANTSPRHQRARTHRTTLWYRPTIISGVATNILEHLEDVWDAQGHSNQPLKIFRRHIFFLLQLYTSDLAPHGFQ